MDRPAHQHVTLVGCVQPEGDFRRARGAGHAGALGTGGGAGNEFVLIDASPSMASGETPRDTEAGTTATGSPTGSATGGTTGETTGATGTTSGTATTPPGAAGGMPGTAGSPSTTGGAVTGTSGAEAAKAYELTGPGEGQLQQYVGRRVEIVGRFKSGDPAAHSGAAASGSTTGRAPGTETESGAASGTQAETTTGTQAGTTAGAQSGTTAGAARGGADTMGQDLNLPEFEVVSVREASGSCPSAPRTR